MGDSYQTADPPDRLDRAARRPHPDAQQREPFISCRNRAALNTYTTCNNPNCRCADPEQRHGPYWQLSWKHASKTVSRILPASDAALYREWIANRRRLEATLQEMRDLSRQAGERILAAHSRPFHGPNRSRRPAR